MCSRINRYTRIYIYVWMFCVCGSEQGVLRAQAADLPFQEGEKLHFELHVGLLKAATGMLEVAQEQIPCLDEKNCLYIRAYGKSVGLWRLVHTVDNFWSSHFHPEDKRTHYFSRSIRENKYQKYEDIQFDLKQHRATIRTYHDKNMQEINEEKVYEIPEQVQDIVSGYYFLRTLRFDTLLSEHIISLPAVFEDTVYDFKIRYLGTGYVRTKLGKFKAYILSPIMPENKLFRGENAIKIWISADKNRIPLMAKIKMWVGSVRAELSEVKHLRYPLEKE